MPPQNVKLPKVGFSMKILIDKVSGIIRGEKKTEFDSGSLESLAQQNSFSYKSICGMLFLKTVLSVKKTCVKIFAFD